MKGKLLRSLAAALCLACLLLPVRAEEAPEVKLTLLGHSVGISLPANDRLDLAVSASCDGILTIRWPISGSPAYESPVSEGRNDLSVEIWEEGMEAPPRPATATLCPSTRTPGLSAMTPPPASGPKARPKAITGP